MSKTYEELQKENKKFREMAPEGITRYVDRYMSDRKMPLPPKFLVHVYDDYTTDDPEQMANRIEEFDTLYEVDRFIATCEHPTVVYIRSGVSKEFK